ncbi:hypothetical protein SAY86_001152 [Trapa natans]|uniref:Protein kinase domain-containing protein n=1 Tax=Trapa natans TaxID=22666 RepID=A0AAN7MD52_TRANT|nr:hypothetical protein SAY86_001152 [Trapa natans]
MIIGDQWLLLLRLIIIITTTVPQLAHSMDPAFNDDVLGLIAFKAGLIDPYSKLASWNQDDDSPCSWAGVRCDPWAHRVTELALDGLSLSGHVGHGLLRLQSLQILSLSNNRLNGTILPGLTSLGTLQVINLSGNNLTGAIPEEMFGHCGSLAVVSFAMNGLTGRIPGSLSTCQTLVAINFSMNRLSGEMPSEIWSLRGLQSIDLSENLLEGRIPEGIGNLYNAKTVNLSGNRFSGRIPEDVGGYFGLEKLDLSGNFLSGSLPESIRRLASVSSIRLRGNSLSGVFPYWIGELRSLESLDLSRNRFFGGIPESVGNLQQLKELNLSMNNFTGILPSSISNCIDLSVLDISHNGLTGDFPLHIFRNNNLEVLDVSSNAFSGEFPARIGTAMINLQYLNASGNAISGSIAESIGELRMIRVLDLSKNRLSGSIPTEIQRCSSLVYLVLSENNLTGPVPLALSKLFGLEYVDLSVNHLTGSLPKELANLTHLFYFNISNNNLEGELPVGGFFDTVHPKPIVLNPNSNSTRVSSSSSLSKNLHHKRIIFSISALIAIGAAASIAIGVIAITILNIHVRSSMSRADPPLAFSGGKEEDISCSPSPSEPKNNGKLVMFNRDANFMEGAANALLNKESEIGRGGFGIVYRSSIYEDGRPLAIKKLTCSGLMKSREDFEREVKTLGKIRHPNIIPLEGYYWEPSLQLLVYEHVSGGSLHRRIHDQITTSSCLTWPQRFKIIIGMAKGLAHLHQMKVVHYNLKSANILLDASGEARVGDFGLARLVPALDRCLLSSKIQSALGYVAPEFACRTVKITEKCDVYGFGVLVLEVVTGRRPVEYMEDDVAVLSEVVRSAVDEGRVEGCVDGRLGGCFPAEEVVSVVKLGLLCASPVPSSRPDMSEVVKVLEMIRRPPES